MWAEVARYVDPLASVSGHEQISDLIGAIQQQAPGHVFRLLDDRVDGHHNIVRFSWELVPASGGESLAIGFDVAVTEDDGRIGSVLRLPRQGRRSLSAIIQTRRRTPCTNE